MAAGLPLVLRQELFQTWMFHDDGRGVTVAVMACLTIDGVVVIETMPSAAEKVVHVVTTDDFSPNHLAELLLKLGGASCR